MLILGSLLGLMIAAVALTGLARRLKTPAPVLLAVGGAALGLLPHPPLIQLDPNITLAVFVAPILLDAAYDTSLRDLRDNWRPVTALVLGAVALTTVLVAYVAHRMAGLPWAAAVALGAIVAPPDAVAATAVLRAVSPPHRVMVILEGESLLNDASALLIYRLAVAAAVTGSIHVATAAPLFVLTAAASVLLGFATAWVNVRLLARVRSPGSTVLQFVTTIGLWLVADALHLSAVLTLVAFGMTAARRAPRTTSARERVASYAVWDFAVFVLQVLAFVLIGLQLRPILQPLTGAQRLAELTVAGAVLAAVILARAAWVMGYNTVVLVGYRLFGFHPRHRMTRATVRSGLVVSWSGMRGIVTSGRGLRPAVGFSRAQSDPALRVHGGDRHPADPGSDPPPAVVLAEAEERPGGSEGGGGGPRSSPSRRDRRPGRRDLARGGSRPAGIPGRARDL